MVVMNTLLNPFKEFQLLLSASTKGLAFKPLEALRHNVKIKPKSFSVVSSSPTFSKTRSFSKDCSYVFENSNLNQIIEKLRTNGFCLGINLSQQMIQEIMQFARNTPCYGDGKNSLGFCYLDKEQAQLKHGNLFASGVYYNTALQCPAIRKLESDALLLEIAANYLGGEPIHQGNRLWWNFPVESSLYQRRQSAQMFHCNSDERRSVKFLFYLTDVDLCSSPYVCVGRSHKKKKLSKRLLDEGLSFQQITEYYSYKNIVPICGKAGFGFVVDTCCFRQEAPPGSKARLVLQIEFAPKNYGIQNDFREASQLTGILFTSPRL